MGLEVVLKLHGYLHLKLPWPLLSDSSWNPEAQDSQNSQFTIKFAKTHKFYTHLTLVKPTHIFKLSNKFKSYRIRPASSKKEKKTKTKKKQKSTTKIGQVKNKENLITLWKFS